MGIRWGPRGVRFLLREVSLYPIRRNTPCACGIAYGRVQLNSLNGVLRKSLCRPLRGNRNLQGSEPRSPIPAPSTQTPKPYRGTSPIRKRLPLGPYSMPMPRVPGGSHRGGRFLMGEVPLYILNPKREQEGMGGGGFSSSFGRTYS